LTGFVDRRQIERLRNFQRGVFVVVIERDESATATDTDVRAGLRRQDRCRSRIPALQ
jgi:hypothetical protein